MNTRGESEDVFLRHGGLNCCNLKLAKHQHDEPSETELEKMDAHKRQERHSCDTSCSFP